MNINTAHFPDELSVYLSGREFTAESIGMSGDGVWISEDMVLKAEANIPLSCETVKVMRWMAGRLPVPEVIAHTVSSGKSWLLMSRIKGKMSCDAEYLEQPRCLAEILAGGLWMLWDADVSGCPRDRSLDVELKDARRRVESGLVTELAPGCGFGSPEELLRWLENSRPDYDPVISHGDYCLPNVFIDGGRVSGLVDLGDSGTADRYRDLALCYRSFRQNLDGTFGGRVYPVSDPELLIEALGITPDREKLRYYLLLGELF